MKKLNNTWKFAGQMVGEVVSEWAANKLLKEG